MKTILIGIDPSFVNCGVAIYHPSTQRFESLYTSDLQSAVDFIAGKNIIREAVVVIENPAMNSHFFPGWDGIRKAVLGKAGIQQIESEFRKAAKFAQNVGESKAAAKFLISTFERAGVPVIQVSPTERHRANKVRVEPLERLMAMTMPTKTTSEQFNALTGFVGRSSEHARDAGTLVYGKTMVWANYRIQVGDAKQVLK